MPLRTTLQGLREFNEKPYSVPPYLAPRHLPSLDGFRALSILIVILGHAKFSLGFPAELKTVLDWAGVDGSLGVRIFFVLSGFLITTLLIKEEVLTGRIDLKKFYSRRIFRIIPAFYVFIAILLLLNYFLAWGIDWRLLASPALFLSNFSFLSSVYITGHTWSLAVEEQYYLLWPVLFKKKKLAAIVLAVSCFILSPLFHRFMHHIPSIKDALLIPFWIYADAIFLGSLLAIVLSKEVLNTEWIRKNKTVINVFGWITCFLIQSIIINHLTGFTGSIILKHIQILVIALLITANIFRSNDLFSRFFNSAIMELIGKASYSLYLWQQLFLIPVVVDFQNDKVWTHFPVNIILVFATGFLSYFFIEKIFLKMKEKYKKV